MDNKADHQEVEVKLYVQDLTKIRSRLQGLGARLIQLRVHEKNLRFDTRDQALRKEGQVLRLRQDKDVYLTYKGPSDKTDGVLSRTEIEFKIEDYQRGRQFLEALGYEVMIFYEKYRTIYQFKNTHVMLDELPYGNFVEIEGGSIQDIREAAQVLGLKWNPIEASYHALFERVCKVKELDDIELSFKNFAGMQIKIDELGVSSAD